MLTGLWRTMLTGLWRTSEIRNTMNKKYKNRAAKLKDTAGFKNFQKRS